MKKLSELRERMLKAEPGDAKTRSAIESFSRNTNRPLGRLNPWTWWPELVRGCNLSCVFCPARLIDRKDWEFMGEETWRDFTSLVGEVTPRGRVNFAMLGEPTLHPRLLEYVRFLRREVPEVQITTYTNGVRLIKREITYGELFDAGINCIFTDMYSSYEAHKKLAEESGEEWYHESNKPDSIANVFEYRGPDRRTIRLSESPYSWSKRKMGRGEFHTFLNSLDWPAAEKFGITKVTAPPKRRCDQPSKFVNINVDGSYQLCCAAAMSSRHSRGELGNVSEGLDGFMRFWLGRYMQDARLKLNHKDRAAHELCRECSYVTIRADIPYWRGGFSSYWDGTSWCDTPEYVPSNSPAGELKRMRTVVSSREREAKKADPQKSLFDVSVGAIR